MNYDSKRFRDLGELAGPLIDLVSVNSYGAELWMWTAYNARPSFIPSNALTWKQAKEQAKGTLVVVHQPGCLSCEAGDHGCHNCHKVEPDVTRKCSACGSFEQVVIENEPWE